MLGGYKMEKPWLKFYEPGVPAEIEIPSFPLQNILEDAARDFPENICCVFLGNEIKYSEVNEKADRFATALVEMGIKPGDVVGIILGNMPQFPIAFFGILKAGAIATLVNPLYTPPEIKFQLNDSDAKALVVIDIMHDAYAKIRDETGVKHTIVTTMADAFPGMRVSFELPDVPGYHLWGELLEKTKPKLPKIQIDTKETPAVLIYTGGTTGTPKGAVITHRNLVANAYQCRAWIHFAERGAGDATLAVLPFFHSFGLTVCMLNTILLAGKIILHPRPDIGQILRDIPKYKVRFMPGTPTLYVSLINNPDLAQHDLSSLTACLSGAAPLPMAVARKFEEIAGANLVEGFGLTEASPVTHGNPIQETPPFDKQREGSIGVPFPNTLARIVDPETGKDVPIGKIGELIIKGPQVMKGYFNKPEETANQLRNGWLHTGDMARMDDDGYFYIVDRLKQMIDQRSGFKIYPRQVEEVLFEHPAVADASVVGIPSEKRGEAVMAFIVLKEGVTATVDEIRAFCKERLTYYKVPEFIEFRTELPKSMVGKTLRRVLREEYLEKQGKS